MPKAKKNGKDKAPRVPFTYDKDSKRYHRYSIGEEGSKDVVGNLYISKQIPNIPDKIILIKNTDE